MKELLEFFSSEKYFRVRLMQLISAHIFHLYIVVSNPSRDIGHILDFVTRLKKLRVSSIRVAILTDAEQYVSANISKPCLYML